MSALLAASLRHYVRFYQDYAAEKWENLTPMQYGILLIGVGVFGWLLMKSANKR